MFALNLGPYRKSGRLDDGEVVIRSAAAYEKTSRICFAKRTNMLALPGHFQMRLEYPG
jgi:hypothetical protein